MGKVGRAAIDAQKASRLSMIDDTLGIQNIILEYGWLRQGFCCCSFLWFIRNQLRCYRNVTTMIVWQNMFF